MRLTGRIWIAFLVVFTVGQGCHEDSVSLYDYQSILKCHNESNWNLESTENKIIGLWEWKYIRCCGETANPYENDTESKGLKIEFKDDGTGVLINNDVSEEFTWTIGTYDVLYGFSTEPSITQISGQLIFCDDIMMCNASYADGADNFFKKLD
jgi:hypothetical protein